MKSIFHKAESRGNKNFGWLDTYHSFSFGQYYDPERIHFGALTVLNDDKVAAAKGFGSHSHRNMEIISIPLLGDLEHKDSMQNTEVIKAGDIQLMSAGKGVVHSEYNKNNDKEVHFLQIWVIPNEKETKPRYSQITLDKESLKNQLFPIVTPFESEVSTQVRQNAWLHLGDLETGISLKYDLKDKENGVYVFVIEGEIEVNNTTLNKRDGLGIWETDAIEITSKQTSKVLLIEVPMISLD